MELFLRKIDANKESVITVSEAVFGCVFNESLVHQVIVSYQLNSRQGTRAQKTRAEVSGSNRKPWRQKGTGRARSGSIRSPIWRSGGVTFAAKPKRYVHKVNRKMYRGAMRSILSELVRQNRLLVIESFIIDSFKTRVMVQKLRNLDLLNNVLIVTDVIDKNLVLATRNLYKVKICGLSELNPFRLVSFDKVVVTLSMMKKIEKMLLL